MLRSISVIVGSYVLAVVLVLATDPLLARLFPGDYVDNHVPSNAALLASTACFILVSIFSAWFCARFAPRRPPLHVLWFCTLGAIMGIAFTFPNWGKGWPLWFGLSWLLTWPVSCWLGLKISGRKDNVVASA